MFTVMLAVLAAYAHILVARAVLLQIRQLEIQGFLHAEAGRTLVQYHSGRRFPAIGPDIVSVIGRAVTDVIGHHFEGFRFLRVASQTQGQQGCQD